MKLGDFLVDFASKMVMFHKLGDFLVDVASKMVIPQSYVERLPEAISSKTPNLWSSNWHANSTRVSRGWEDMLQGNSMVSIPTKSQG